MGASDIFQQRMSGFGPRGLGHRKRLSHSGRQERAAYVVLSRIAVTIVGDRAILLGLIATMSHSLLFRSAAKTDQFILMSKVSTRVPYLEQR
jgi:hypothetical protein